MTAGSFGNLAVTILCSLAAEPEVGHLRYIIERGVTRNPRARVTRLAMMISKIALISQLRLFVFSLLGSEVNHSFSAA